jgi:hypothetical protein
VSVKVALVTVPEALDTITSKVPLSEAAVAAIV